MNGKSISWLMQIILIFFCCLSITHGNTYNKFHFEQLPDLPSLTSGIPQEGVAGSFSGISNGVLIIAGGTNFPTQKPWQGGEKVYYDDIYILQLNPLENNHKWYVKTFKLPNMIAYGASLTLDEGVLCLGGNDHRTCYNRVRLIQWQQGEDTISMQAWPDLPVALTSFSAVLCDRHVYVIGGSQNLNGADSARYFFTLNLAERDSDTFNWRSLPPWPGPSRIFPVAVTQSNGNYNCIYLFSGRNVSPEGKITVLYDGYVFNPTLGNWANLSEEGTLKFPVMAGVAFPTGTNGIVFLGGAEGNLPDRDLSEHPGFSRDILIYNTVTSTLYNAGLLPFPTQVNTAAVPFRNGFLIPSGEIRPGVRTPALNYISIKSPLRSLDWVNILVLMLYFAVLGWMGWYFSKRQKSTHDFFKGGGRIPWWAAGLSIFGTVLSAITFMAIPAKTYASDWSYFMYNMGTVLVAPIIILLFIPYFRKQDVTTAYEFLEMRFNLTTRLIGSLAFILFQIGRMAVVLLLPSIALSVVTGIDVILCILIMGLISMIYTSIGGIEAVVWTDVIQVIVLLGGALLSLVLISFEITGGLGGIIDVGIAQDKFNLFNTILDLKKPFLWTVLIGSLFANLTTYGTDQTVVQRYLTVKTQNAAAKGVWTNALMAIPATLLFFMMGTALYTFYRYYPDQLIISLNNADAIFPWYIVTQLPLGVSGLLIAGILAASMSSLSSSINSAATAYHHDFHNRFGWSKRISSLKVAQWASVIIGLLGTFFAVFMASWDIKSLWDEFLTILGLVLGGLTGVFLLGILSKRSNALGALSGMVISALVQYLVAVFQPVHVLLYIATGVISCFLSGWLISIIFSVKGEK